MSVHTRVSVIEAVSATLTEMLGDDFDAQTFWDTLDGETDIIDLINQVLRHRSHDRALAEAAKVEASNLAARAKRLADRDAAHKKALKMLLDAAGQRKVETPLATISVQKGRTSVRITDAAAVPSQLCKTTVTPDKAAILTQIRAGEFVPGAEMSTGEETVSVRVK